MFFLRDGKVAEMKTGNKKAGKMFNKRAVRVRSHLRGTVERPRMCVVKSNKQLYVQLIDDVNGKTLASAQTGGKGSQGTELAKKSKTSAKMIGEMIAQKAKTLGISQVIFDRGPFKYHGILAELANAARQQGLLC
jgi:large subunit ribosomal protein L18